MSFRAFLIIVAIASTAFGQVVQPAVRHDTTTIAIRDIPLPALDEPLEEVHVEHRVRPIPFPRPAAGAPRAALEAPATPANTQLPLTIQPFFFGIGVDHPTNPYTVRHAPPDTTGAVGTTQYVQWVNEAFAVFDKSGN